MGLEFEREFLLRLAAPYLGCRLAVMGGRPLVPTHQPVTDMPTLAWALLGVHDYGHEMRIMLQQIRVENRKGGGNPWGGTRPFSDVSGTARSFPTACATASKSSQPTIEGHSKIRRV